MARAIEKTLSDISKSSCQYKSKLKDAFEFEILDASPVLEFHQSFQPSHLLFVRDCDNIYT